MPLIRYADWKKPTDEAYAFRLRAATGVSPAAPPPGAVLHVDELVRRALVEEDAERFAARLDRWTGPEDVQEGEQPFARPQDCFEERGPARKLKACDTDLVLRGRALVFRGPSGQTDYVLRDHHMLDVVMYHHLTTGELPRALFHADRHSDWCKDSYLLRRRPQQAATWWPLLEGLKRPGDGAPVLRDEDIHFTTAIAPAQEGAGGRDIGYEQLVPYSRDPDALGFGEVLDRPGADACDWVSVDLDYLQPSAQLALSGGLLRDARFGRLMQQARVRVFVLSPQFLNGGDKIPSWTVQGSVASSRRLINLMTGQLKLPNR